MTAVRFGKGHVFDANEPATLPSFVGRALTGEALERWCREQTDRYRFVATCDVAGCGRQLIAGEALPHALKHASNGRVRSAAGTVLQQRRADALEALALIQKLIDLVPEEA